MPAAKAVPVVQVQPKAPDARPEPLRQLGGIIQPSRPVPTSPKFLEGGDEGPDERARD